MNFKDLKDHNSTDPDEIPFETNGHILGKMTDIGCPHLNQETFNCILKFRVTPRSQLFLGVRLVAPKEFFQTKFFKF